MTGKPGSSGTVRNPEKFCKAIRSDGGPCQQYALQNLDVCRFHGGATPGARDSRAKAEIVKMAGLFDIPTPVEPADFAEVSGQYVGIQNQIVAALLDDLRRKTQGMDAVDVVRQYSDILDRINWSQRETARMMTTAGDLRAKNPRPAPGTAKVPEELLREALTGIRERLAAAGIFAGPQPCQKCGHVNQPEKPDEGKDAEVHPFRPDFI